MEPLEISITSDCRLLFKGDKSIKIILMGDSQDIFLTK